MTRRDQLEEMMQLQIGGNTSPEILESSIKFIDELMQVPPEQLNVFLLELRDQYERELGIHVDQIKARKKKLLIYGSIVIAIGLLEIIFILFLKK